MAVTLREVARRAGVSPSAVSRAFTEGASVSPAMRRRVEEAAAALGYSPNALASSLTTGRTRLVGLVATNFRNPVFLEIFDRFTLGLQARGLRPLLVNLSGETDPAASVRLLRQYSVDGVIVASSTLPPSFAEAFVASGLRVVHAFGRPGATADLPAVGIDNVACGRLAARTLRARGYGRLAFLGGPEAATSTQDRLAGLREGLGGDLRVRFAAAYSHRAGWDAMRALLAEGAPPEAVFCGDDVLALGALDALRAAGLGVPGDVGLLGVNDMEMAGWPGIDLTTIRQPMAEIIEAALEAVLAPDAPGRVLPCEVVERGTLRPLP